MYFKLNFNNQGISRRLTEKIGGIGGNASSLGGR